MEFTTHNAPITRNMSTNDIVNLVQKHWHSRNYVKRVRPHSRYLDISRDFQSGTGMQVTPKRNNRINKYSQYPEQLCDQTRTLSLI